MTGAFCGRMAVARSCSLAYLRAVDALRDQIRTITPLSEALRTEDVDAIHDARVASRRLRAILSEFGSLFAAPGVKRLREQARQVTRGLGKARDIGLAAAYLAGEGGRYITGATIDVNGGMYLR